MAGQRYSTMHSESDWGVSQMQLREASVDLEKAYGTLQVLARFAANPREQRFAGAAAQAVAEAVDAVDLAQKRVREACQQLIRMDREAAAERGEDVG